MADADYEDFEAGYGDSLSAALSPARLSRVIHVTGAVASLGLVVWLGWWGYDMAARGAHGVPVIKASGTPMRITPEKPGGVVVDHQGLAVNDIAAVGMAAPLPDRLTLAPAATDLTDEDVAGLTPLNVPLDAPQGALPGTVAVPAATAPLLPLAVPDLSDPATPVVPAAAPAPATDAAVAAALAEALSNDGAEDLALEAASPAEPLRPRTRPEPSIDPVAPAIAVEGAPAVAPVEVDPATLAQGTRLAQLGAYDTPEQARAEWVRAVNAYPDLMLAKAMVIQEGQSGGRSFYRLRVAGFEDEVAARDFCGQIVGRNGTCIPVVHR
jgi:hypothetical protein